MAGAKPRFWGEVYGRSRDPYPAYRTIRDRGSAVWMPRRRLWAVGRHEDVRMALRAGDVLVSGRGVAANDLINGRLTPITLTSDGGVHDRRRLLLIQPLLPGPIKALRGRLEDEADRLVRRLADGQQFEAMSQFASHLPLTVVAELVGLSEEARGSLLRWAAATFDVLGVMNTRGLAALPAVVELGRYIQGLDRAKVAPGGWADRLLEAAERGEISADEARAMVIDYVGPALDTTILASGHMLWRLATTPGAYETLCAEPELIPSLVNESVRLASPIRGFTRYALEDVEIGDSVIPKGSRALILFASANRDERRYAAPDVFDIRRNPRDHVGWGHGPHTCVGMHLARLEMELLAESLVRHVALIEVGAPRAMSNNVLQGFAALPAAFHARQAH